jgi:hypothetical protein
MSEETVKDENTNNNIKVLKTKITGFDRLGENTDFSHVDYSIFATKEYDAYVIKEIAARIEELKNDLRDTFNLINAKDVSKQIDFKFKAAGYSLEQIRTINDEL